MTKKEYIITFLDKVKDIWEPARGFAVLMRYDIFNDQQIDTFFELFKSVVHSTNDQQRKRKLQLAIDNIDAIRRKEKKSESSFNLPISSKNKTFLPFSSEIESK